MQENPALLQAEVDKENTANRKRVDETKQIEAAQKAEKPKAENDFDRGDQILDKENITNEDKKAMEKILESLEEKTTPRNLTKTIANDSARCSTSGRTRSPQYRKAVQVLTSNRNL